MKVAVACPTITKPYEQFLDACRAEAPLLEAAGIENLGIAYEVGSPYISFARASALRKALDTQPDVVVFIDHDMSWKPGELLRLIRTEGPVVAGTYRFKQAEEKYMGNWRCDADRNPETRPDGCIRGEWVPAGFLKVTGQAIHDFMGAYPELIFGSRYRPHIDLFNHGASDYVWYGEDYAFSRRWNAAGGEIWIVPDLELTHHGADGTPYPGNLSDHLRRREERKRAADPATLQSAA
jgi:hypothetical protein